MNFYVASRGGSPLTLASQQGGSCLNCSTKIIRNFPPKLSSLDFHKLKLLYLLRQATKLKIEVFYICKCKSYSVLVVLL